MMSENAFDGDNDGTDMASVAAAAWNAKKKSLVITTFGHSLQSPHVQTLVWST